MVDGFGCGRPVHSNLKKKLSGSHLRNKTKESGSLALASICASRRDRSLLKKLRRAEKACVSVTCDVVANVLEW